MIKLIRDKLRQREMKTIFENYECLLKYGTEEPVLSLMKYLTVVDYKCKSGNEYFINNYQEASSHVKIILYPKSMIELDKDIVSTLSKFQTKEFIYHACIMNANIINILSLRFSYMTAYIDKCINLGELLNDPLYVGIITEYLILCSLKVSLEDNKLFNIYVVNTLGTMNVDSLKNIRNNEILSEPFTDFVKALNVIQPKLVKLISDDLVDIYEYVREPKSMFDSFDKFQKFEDELDKMSIRIRFLTSSINIKLTKLIESIEHNIFKIEGLYEDMMRDI